MIEKISKHITEWENELQGYSGLETAAVRQHLDSLKVILAELEKEQKPVCNHIDTNEMVGKFVKEFKKIIHDFEADGWLCDKIINGGRQACIIIDRQAAEIKVLEGWKQSQEIAITDLDNIRLELKEENAKYKEANSMDKERCQD